jgi:hypothetical protein
VNLLRFALYIFQKICCVKYLQLLVFPWFYLTFLIAYSKVMLKASNRGVSGHYEYDINN